MRGVYKFVISGLLVLVVAVGSTPIAGLAVGLGALLTPLGALLPTIQLGLGKDNNCNALIRTAEQPPRR